MRHLMDASGDFLRNRHKGPRSNGLPHILEQPKETFRRDPFVGPFTPCTVKGPSSVSERTAYWSHQLSMEPVSSSKSPLRWGRSRGAARLRFFITWFMSSAVFHPWLNLNIPAAGTDLASTEQLDLYFYLSVNGASVNNTGWCGNVGYSWSADTTHTCVALFLQKTKSVLSLF